MRVWIIDMVLGIVFLFAMVVVAEVILTYTDISGSARSYPWGRLHYDLPQPSLPVIFRYFAARQS